MFPHVLNYDKFFLHSLRRSNLNGIEQLIHCIKCHIEKRISKCLLEDLVLLKEDLLKLVSAIDNHNIDSSLLRVKIAELIATLTEYSSLHVVSSKKLNPEVRAQQLAAIDLLIAQVRSSQQAVLEGYQAT
ncbi:hypothetical protein ACFX2I_027758 [Malus domestica]